MSSALLPRMAAPELFGTTEPSPWQGDVVVPAIAVEGVAPDPVALATWHMALASSIAVEIPNDLFALWLFPASGGVVLLGPEALAQDRVRVPLPGPQLLQDELYQLEEVLRRAKYDSAIAVPIRQGARDVGVMLLGRFGRGGFSPAQAIALFRVAGRLAPAMAQLSEAMPSIAPHATLEPVMPRDALPEHLARAACEAVSGPDLIRRIGGILYPLLPHDRLEILVPGNSESSFSALSGNAPRRRWSVGSPGVEPFTGIVARFGTASTLVLEDLDTGQSEWSVGGGAPPTLPARSVLGARLEVGGRVVGYLLLGSVARDAYRPDDEDIVALAALILAPRIASLRPPEAGPTRVDPDAARELPLYRAAEVLAGTAHLGEGLAGFAAELNRMLPHVGIALHLRWGDQDVVALDPGSPRPLADLPATPLEEFAGAEILRGEREWLVRNHHDGEEVLVALRVAGRTIGTLGARSSGFTSVQGAAAVTRRFADVLAPHLELLRRGSGVGGPAGRASSARVRIGEP